MSEILKFLDSLIQSITDKFIKGQAVVDKNLEAIEAGARYVRENIKRQIHGYSLLQHLKKM